MLKASVNEIYTATKVYKGTSVKGDYELIVLEAEGNDRARMPIWVQNVPCNIVEGMRFTIAAINGASIRHIKPSDKFDKWQDEYSIDAYVLPYEA